MPTDILYPNLLFGSNSFLLDCSVHGIVHVFWSRDVRQRAAARVYVLGRKEQYFLLSLRGAAAFQVQHGTLMLVGYEGGWRG